MCCEVHFALPDADVTLLIAVAFVAIIAGTWKQIITIMIDSANQTEKCSVYKIKNKKITKIQIRPKKKKVAQIAVVSMDPKKKMYIFFF